MRNVYNTQEWRDVRALVLARDGHRCTVGRWLGGRCSPPDVPLQVHHLTPIAEGGDPFDLDNAGTACAVHHPQWEHLRREIVHRRHPRVACPHRHQSKLAREICERRLARERGLLVA